MVYKTKIRLERKLTKMKLGKLLLGLTLIGTTFGAFAQEESEQERECKRMRFLAGKKIDIEDYKGAAEYYIKGEQICGGYEKDNYDRLIAVLNNVITTETDPAIMAAYRDTLLNVFSRAEAAGQYGQEHDLTFATYLAQHEGADKNKADMLFKRGMAAAGKGIHEAYLGIYYYNLYMVYYSAPEDKKSEKKKDFISEYFTLSQLVSDAGMSINTQDNLNYYFNLAIQSCNDILPDLKGYMANLPEDPAQKISTVKNFINVLETKNCTDSEEYEQLVFTLVEADPSSFDAQIAKAKLLESKRKFSAAITSLKEAKGLTQDPAQIGEIEYAIARNLLNSGSYTSAYNAGMALDGKFKGKGLEIAARAVAANKDNCGASTFERKCNYYYAVELLERASANGESVGGLIASYRANFPTESEMFDNNKSAGQSVSLPCYGATVTLK